MVALRICVLVCAPAGQFPIKLIFYQDGFSLIKQSTIDTFHSAREGVPFIIVHETVENVMRSQFNIKTATANYI